MQFALTSLFLGAGITIVFYVVGLLIKKKWKLAILNPILISATGIILFLIVCKVDYDTYYESSKYISYFLTPATVCLAVPLYEQIKILKKNMAAILCGIASGIISSILCVFATCKIFGLDHTMYVTFMTKSISSAIGMGVSKELNGVVAITISVTILTGVFGNMIAELVFKIFKIKEPIAKGVAIGTSSHAIGTAKALEIGEIEGAMSSLSLAVSGIITALLASFFAMWM